MEINLDEKLIDEKLIDKIDWDILNQSSFQEEVPAPIDDDEDVMRGEFLRNYIVFDLCNEQLLYYLFVYFIIYWAYYSWLYLKFFYNIYG